MGARRRIGGWARSLGWLAVLGCGLMLLWSFTAAGARTPAANEHSATWLKAGCYLDGPAGTVAALGSLGTNVLVLPDRGATYYQQIEVSIDKLVLGEQWRSVKKKTRTTREFTAAALPAHSTSGVRAVLGPVLAENGVMSLRATVTLKRVRRGPDATVWRQTLRTDRFTCAPAGVPAGT